MESPFDITLLMVLAVMAGVSAQVMGNYLKVPSIVFLLAFGIALGQDGLGWIEPHLLGDGLEVIVSLSVALILFEGGLELDLANLKQLSGSLRNLITIGPVITLIGGGWAAHTLGGFPWSLSFLYASLVVVTGPTVIGPLLKQVKVDRQVSTLLEGEGVLIDPVGAILAVIVLNVISSGDAHPLQLFTDLTLRLGIGGAIGALGGWLLSWVLKRARDLSESLKSLVVLAGLWDLYGLAQVVKDESGLMATVVAGVVLSALATPEVRLVKRFKNQLTILAVSVLFILLSANLSLASVVALGWGSVATVLVLMVIIRPLTIWICTWGSQFNWRQKLFISWIGPKGIVSASVASLFSLVLAEREITGGEAIKALVFLTIIMTVVIQGLSAQAVANGLRVSSGFANGVVIVGSNPLARLIADLFSRRDEPVVLIESDPETCQRSIAQQNLRVFLSSTLDSHVLEEVGLESMGTFVALTVNGEVNFVLAQKALEEFELPRVLAVFRDNPTKESKIAKVQQALTLNLPLQTWNQLLQEDQVQLIEATLQESGFVAQRIYLQALVDSGNIVPLVIESGDQLRVARAGSEWQPGDRVTFMVQKQKAEILKWVSGRGPSRSALKLDQVPLLREVPLFYSPSQPEPMIS